MTGRQESCCTFENVSTSYLLWWPVLARKTWIMRAHSYQEYVTSCCCCCCCCCQFVSSCWPLLPLVVLYTIYCFLISDLCNTFLFPDLCICLFNGHLNAWKGVHPPFSLRNFLSAVIYFETLQESVIMKQAARKWQVTSKASALCRHHTAVRRLVFDFLSWELAHCLVDTPVLGTFTPILVSLCLFFFELGAHVGWTDRWAGPVMHVLRQPHKNYVSHCYLWSM